MKLLSVEPGAGWQIWVLPDVIKIDSSVFQHMKGIHSAEKVKDRASSAARFKRGIEPTMWKLVIEFSLTSLVISPARLFFILD